MSDKTLTDICFESFDLHPNLLKGLDKAGFIRCTPIQAMSLPLTLAGRDVAGQAQTGTGKTAAFLVALYNHLLNKPSKAARRAQDARAVILAPTRELAIQIDKDAHQIGYYTGMRVGLVYGGVDYEKQRKQLEDGVDIIIATPGRLIDFVKQHAVSVGAVEMMIMDEADRMFDLGFIKDIRFLLRRMPGASERQNLLFSATLSHRVLELAYDHMNDPEKLVVETESVTASSVRQKVYFPATEEKLPLLLGLLGGMDANRTMVFVNTKFGCERVALTLERAGYKVGVLSGDVPQKKRESLLAGFVKGDLSLLVATDVAARGLHIPGVSHVFNFDLPFDAEDYVHRIGRTARLGAEGDAISFACDEYAIGLPDIEAFIEMKIPVAAVDPALLLPLPPRRAPRAHGETGGETVIEDALSAANAERQRRRERDGGGRRREGGERSSPARARSGMLPGGGPSRGERPPRAAQPQETVAEAPARVSPNPERAPATNPNEGEQQRKRRRRPRRPQDGAAPADPMPPAVADKTVTSSGGEPPKLRTRLKQKMKSWFQQFRAPSSGPRH
ncbi:MAG: ATP-dependent RNA helicase RhlB [Gammaproteobacteria bacterium]|nr:ATP-dependent RNA helicase RhlB [Gammaproteobacteria bacterium]